ncbi:MAG: hypothetical protein JSR59_11510 [Proteobacteria bacterium]|nr:hypothetical protein [Pseudomonadota bacterium]
MAVSGPDPRFIWMSRFADELLALRPDFKRDVLLVEAARAHEAMGQSLSPQEAAHLWPADGESQPPPDDLLW